MANILLGVTGGIAAYKAVFLSRLLHKEGHTVKIIMTDAATKFIAPLTFEGIGNEVFVDDFSGRAPLSHIELAKWANLMIIAPATANTIAKIASGIADNLLTSCVLAYTKSLLICPAMNGNMYLNTATFDNINKLKSRGVQIVAPVSGELACGDTSVGKLEEPENIVNVVKKLLNSDRSAEGLRILITAGPTVEPIDPVRYISNYSSGKMGYAIASAAGMAGAYVTLVSGPVCINAPDIDEFYSVESATDMYNRVSMCIEKTDIAIMAAAVADYAPKAAPEKIKKDSDNIILDLHKNIDILKTTAMSKKNGQIFVGFAAESENIEQNALKKLHDKNLDMLVANDISRTDIGFNSGENEVTIYYPNQKPDFLSKRPKEDIASYIIKKAAELFKTGGK